MPAWLSGEKAIQIYEEIKNLTIEFVNDVREENRNPSGILEKRHKEDQYL